MHMSCVAVAETLGVDYRDLGRCRGGSVYPAKSGGNNHQCGNQPTGSQNSFQLQILRGDNDGVQSLRSTLTMKRGVGESRIAGSGCATSLSNINLLILARLCVQYAESRSPVQPSA